MSETRIQTPTSIVVIAACPKCSQRQPARVHLNAELVVSDEGSVLKVKAKTSPVEHVCGQLSFEDPARAAVQPLLDLATDTGTSMTIEHAGRTVTIGGRRVDVETGEVLP